MNRTSTACTAALIVLALTACNQTSPSTANASASNHDADVRALRDNEAQWNQDFAAKDPAKLAAHYADDAVFMTTGMPAAIGKARIQKAFETLVASDPAFSLQFKPMQVEVAGSGDLAYTRGVYTLKMTDPQTKKVINDDGSYVTTYRKQSDGTWKATEDIASSEVMSQPAPPAKGKAPAKP